MSPRGAGFASRRDREAQTTAEETAQIDELKETRSRISRPARIQQILAERQRQSVEQETKRQEMLRNVAEEERKAALEVADLERRRIESQKELEAKKVTLRRQLGEQSEAYKQEIAKLQAEEDQKQASERQRLAELRRFRKSGAKRRNWPKTSGSNCASIRTRLSWGRQVRRSRYPSSAIRLRRRPFPRRSAHGLHDGTV